MDTTTLGRTGLTVSVAALGGGGHSRLGQKTGKTRAESIRVVHEALDLGINFFDTARTYGTESLMGEALKGKRQDVVLATKSHVAHNPFSPTDFQYLTAQELTDRVDESLRNLRTDYIDIFHMHGVETQHYDACLERIVPVLERLRAAGKVRFFGLTERFAVDTRHDMLARAVQDNVWDVMMVGFNMLNPSARHRVLAETQKKGIGTLAMFAVRQALSRPEALQETLEAAVEAGQLRASDLGDRPLAFLTEECGADSLTEAGYRFARHEPGIDVVLTGTGNIEHLRQNVAAIAKPPLPDTCLARLNSLFGGVDTVSGD